jgi:probable HAF family extracellular repeat protein
MGINASGNSAGYASDGIYDHAVLWRKGKVHDLGTLPGGSMSLAYSTNDSDEIVGSSDGEGHQPQALLWDKHQHLHDLGTLPAGNYSQALAINQRGKVAGYSNDKLLVDRAISWTKRGGMKDLGTLRGGGTASAIGINNLGQIVGGSDAKIDGVYYCCRAALWKEGKKPQDLGTLPGNSWSTANAINDGGEVVGYSGWRAFVWSRANRMQDLNDLIPSNSGWILQYASAINDRGQITGWGTISSQTHAFLLSRTDQPPWACR